MGVSKTSDCIQIWIKVPNPVRNLQHPPKPKIRTQWTWMFFAPSKLRYRAKITIMAVSKISDHIQIKIKMLNPSQEPPASSKAPKDEFEDMDVLCTFKIKIESLNLDNGCIKDKWPYPNRDQDARSKSGTSSPHRTPEWGLEGHGCSLHLQNFGTLVYHRPVTVFKYRSRCQNHNKNLQCPPKP